ncbi:alkene reductase [Tautonia plasticadhaerens]|uniref:N-ethylmaleimide reductase n=1 Tax=Tautonia plasticadhaerens TaxID=2527974 RepID=A0A518H1B2_9BACT|nr:alkene reductase [Tautonia plasticadhaerens]QDV34618.1 N-ethylmaleimide reductase [Tautonia plasticadhaerens]
MGERPGLFTPVRVGPLELPNRIVMSPMTRIRADEGCAPGERMVRYYAQRASAGLIITEGTHPSPMGRGYTSPPGLHTEEQAAGWRRVTDAVHAAGGRIFVQLMHAGRVSHSSLLPGHALPVAPSAVAVSGEIHTFGGKVPFETPRPLETAEIPAVVGEYRRAAELSIAAGFDGVELHAATGYLPNQFQVTGSNRRTDAYGGSPEGRTRFTLEVVEALCEVRSADRVGIKVAPGFTVNDTFDDDPAETYTHLARRLDPLGLAYFHVGYDSGYSRGTAPPFNPVDLLRSAYTGTLLAVGGFTRASGQEAIEAGRADLIVYGRPFIANPDLVERFRLDAPLVTGDVRTFYGGDDHGYTDYPTLAEQGWSRENP